MSQIKLGRVNSRADECTILKFRFIRIKYDGLRDQISKGDVKDELNELERSRAEEFKSFSGGLM